MITPTLDDVIAARGWDSRQALQMVAILEDFVDAIWKVHGPGMADLLEVQMNSDCEPAP